MKLEITERQALALLNAIEVFEGSYLGYEIDVETKRDIRCAAAVASKIENFLTEKADA